MNHVIKYRCFFTAGNLLHFGINFSVARRNILLMANGRHADNLLFLFNIYHNQALDACKA